MSTRISAAVKAMSEEDVLGMVPDRVIRDIKREDPRPIFKAFCVGQEGIAEPSVIGIGKTIQRWFGGAIKALAMKLNIGTKVFNGHEQNNSHDGRTAVGEVIGKAVEKINGFLSAVAVTYIYPQFKDLPFDVASIEADLAIPLDVKEFEVQEPDVLAVTGIALGNSATDKPAFPGATLQAALQAFAEPERTTQGGVEMTLDDLKKAVQEGKFKPSDLFELPVLISDPLVKEHVKEEKTGEYYARKRRDQEIEEERANWAKEKKALNDEIAAHKSAGLKAKAADTLSDIIKERKLDGDEKLTKFVRKAYEKSFTPAAEATLKKDLDKFVDAQVDEFKDFFSAPSAPAAGEAKVPGVGADTKGTGVLKGEDLLDPAKNDFIPQ